MTTQQTNKIDKILLHPILGYLIFFFIIWLMFFCTFTLGSYPMSLMEEGVGAISTYAHSHIPQGFFNDLVVQGIIGGVGGVIVFLPNILILFMFISLMEETGYMDRVAHLMDRVMHAIGLHGKSFIPLIIGFGCNLERPSRPLGNNAHCSLYVLFCPIACLYCHCRNFFP